MTTEYNWVVSQMDTAPSLDGLTDVVVTVHWRRNATAVTGSSTYFASGESFTPKFSGSFESNIPLNSFAVD